jgi:hypothetical protein
VMQSCLRIHSSRVSRRCSRFAQYLSEDLGVRSMDSMIRACFASVIVLIYEWRF